MRVLSCLAIISLLSGCAITSYTAQPGTPENYRRNPPLFDCGKISRSENILTELGYEETENYTAYDLAIPGYSKPARYLRSKLPGKKKLMVILPIYGNTELPPRTLASYLTDRNDDADFNVIMIRERGELFDWEALQEAKDQKVFFEIMRQGVKEVQSAVCEVVHVLDWAETREETDIGRIGVAGFSIGSIVATISMGMDERVKAGVFFLGGGNIHEVFTDTGAEKVVLGRENAYKNFLMTPKKYSEKLRAIIRTVEPVWYAANIHQDSSLFFGSEYDTFIPVSSREALWEALGRPEKVMLGHGHKVSFLSFTILGGHKAEKIIFEFLRKKLGQ